MEILARVVRARIIWGASADEISDRLRESGADEVTMQRIIRF
jgi:hypothetical protein